MIPKVIICLVVIEIGLSFPFPESVPSYSPPQYHPSENVLPYQPPSYSPQEIVPSYKPSPYNSPAKQIEKDPYNKNQYIEQEPRPYAFDYGVRDDYTGANFGHQEDSDGNTIKGSYSVALPDGRIQKVNYVADHYNGFQAEVTYEGDAIYPEHKPESPKYVEKNQYQPKPQYSIQQPIYQANPRYKAEAPIYPVEDLSEVLENQRLS